MNTYIITLNYGSTLVKITTCATSIENAILIVLMSEGAPECAIVNIKIRS